MKNCQIEYPTILRPKLLVRTARAALAHYSRAIYIKQIGNIAQSTKGNALFEALAREEWEMESLRREKAFTYSPRRHITVLTALMAEMPVQKSMQLAA